MTVPKVVKQRSGNSKVSKELNAEDLQSRPPLIPPTPIHADRQTEQSLPPVDGDTSRDANRPHSGVSGSKTSTDGGWFATYGPDVLPLPELPPKRILEAQAMEASPLHDMASLGRAHAVESLIQAGADREKPDAFGRTPLHIAATLGHEMVVRSFTRLGSKLKTTDLTGATPLHLAAFNGHKQVINALLEARADIGLLCSKGRTPLHHAVSGMQAEVCRHLVLARAEAEARSDNVPTPLMLAVFSGHTLVLDTLIDVHCDTHATDDEGGTPLHISACKQRLEIMDVLVRRSARIESIDDWGLMPIHRAARSGEHEAVKRLVELKAGVSSRTAIGRQSSLHLAAMADELKTIEVLIESKANIDCQDNRGYTAMHSAVEGNRLEALAKLLQLKGNGDLQTKAGDTAIHLAVFRGHTHLTQCIMFYGCNVSARGRSGATPLHNAAEIGSMAGARTLLERDLPPQVQASAAGEPSTGLLDSQRSSTPASPSRSKSRQTNEQGSQFSRVKAISSSKRGTEGHAVAEGDAGPDGSKTASGPANTNARDEKRQTPLHIAAWHGRSKMCQLLVDAGSEVDAADSEGCTPLGLSISKDHDPTVKILLRLKADPMRENPQGLGPLQLACMSGALTVTKTLNEMKMLPKLDETPWRRPMALAKFYGHQAIVDYFFRPIPKNRLALHMVHGKGDGVFATLMAVSTEPPVTALKLKGLEVVAPEAKLPAVVVSEAPAVPSDVTINGAEAALAAVALAAVAAARSGSSGSKERPRSAAPKLTVAAMDDLFSKAEAAGVEFLEREISEKEWMSGSTISFTGLKYRTKYILRLVGENDAGMSIGIPTEVETTTAEDAKHRSDSKRSDGKKLSKRVKA